MVKKYRKRIIHTVPKVNSAVPVPVPVPILMLILTFAVLFLVFAITF